jgi:hypothetical protein
MWVHPQNHLRAGVDKLPGDNNLIARARLNLARARRGLAAGDKRRDKKCSERWQKLSEVDEIRILNRSHGPICLWNRGSVKKQLKIEVAIPLQAESPRMSPAINFRVRLWSRRLKSAHVSGDATQGSAGK